MNWKGWKNLRLYTVDTESLGLDLTEGVLLLQIKRGSPNPSLLYVEYVPLSRVTVPPELIYEGKIPVSL